MILTLALLALPALQEPAPAPAPPPPPAAEPPVGRPQGKGYKNLSDAEYYRGLQLLQEEAARRGDAELAAMLADRLASMDAPRGGRQRDRVHSRNRAKDTRADKRRRGGGARGAAQGSGQGAGRFEKGRRRDRLEGKQSKEAQIEALQREIDRLEKELELRRQQLQKLQSQPDTQVQATQPPQGGRRGATPRGGEIH